MLRYMYIPFLACTRLEPNIYLQFIELKLAGTDCQDIGIAPIAVLQFSSVTADVGQIN
jgi:hypothetical protein